MEEPYQRLQRALTLRSPGEPPLSVIRNPVHDILTYRYSPEHLHDPSASPLDRYLAEEFFTSLYVQREEADRVRDTLGIQRLTIVTGERGCGKTTLLLKAIGNLNLGFPSGDGLDPATPSRSVYYIDLERHRSLRLSESVEGGRQTTFCDVIYDDMLERYNDAATGAWYAYLYDKTESFRQLKRRLMSFVPPRPTWDELLKGVRELGLEALLGTCIERWERQDATAKLSRFLAYFSYAHGHRFSFVIDNIDLYWPQEQAKVIKRLSDLLANDRLASATVGVREAGLHAVHDDLIDHNPVLVQALADKISLTTGTRDAFLAMFIDQRLAVLQRCLPILHTFGALEQSLPEDVIEQATRVVQLRGDLFRALARQTEESGPPARLLSWHNQSLRAAAFSLFLLVDDILSNKEILYPLDEILKIVPHDPASVYELGRMLADERQRFMLSLINRHMLLDDHLAAISKRGRLPTPLLFEPLPDTRETLAALRAHLLLMLIRQPSRSFGSISKDLALFGVGPDEVMASLGWLARSSGPEGRRFVAVEPVSGEPRTHPDTIYHLLPAGELLIRSLVPSCEYLCWSLLLSPTGEQCLDKQDRAAQLTDVAFAERLRSEAYRVDLAIRLVRRRVLPMQMRAATGGLHSNDLTARLDHYIKVFGPRTLVARASRGVWRFARRVATTDEQLQGWRAALEGIVAEMAEPFVSAHVDLETPNFPMDLGVPRESPRDL